MKAKDKILELFELNSELTVKEITDTLIVSKQLVHTILKKLVEEEIILKFGKTPKTVYRNNKLALKKKSIDIKLNDIDSLYLKDNFLLISETGNLLDGLDGFTQWCKTRKLPLEKTIKEFIETKNKYKHYYNNAGLINGLEKIKSTKGYDAIYMDDLFYLDFYAIERFGKTRLGTILHYAKQGQNKMLMNLLVEEIKKKIDSFLQLNQINAVAFVPPTIRREIQLIKFLQTSLKINLPLIEIQKIGGIIPVPQKSLNKLEERINNAEATFIIKGSTTYNKVLLIDDAVGSGATLNQIAGKLKRKKIAQSVIGLAIVGSFKGFDVITDI